jgi:lysophospholipase L1-like esterase
MPTRKLIIVGQGDSTTAGTPAFLSPLEAPPNGRGNPESQYAYWIMKLHPEWTVLNRGINGQRTDQILARFARDVFGRSADYVIVLAGVNDVYQGRSQDAIRKNLSSMYELARENSIRTVAATILPYNYASEGESEAILELNDWIGQTANRMGLLFCDTNAAVADTSERRKLASTPDGLHPDVAGYRRMGEALAAVIGSSL